MVLLYLDKPNLMRLLLILFLVFLCISCKKEEKNLPIQETPAIQNIDVKKERIVQSPDPTRYDSIKTNFSLTSLNFNENRIDFTLPNRLEDFQIEFSNIPNDRLKIGYIKKENTFYIDQEKTLHKRIDTQKNTNLSILLDSLFSSKKHTMTDVVVSKTKHK